MGIGKRIKGAIFGMLFGLILVPGSVVLHCWNEYRTIHRTRGLNEAAQVVVPLADSSQVASEHDQKLVHLSGLAETEETLVDAQFGIRAQAIHLTRQVEMYQWTEDERRENDRTRYSYQTEWASGRVSSESFHNRAGHENPQLRYQGQKISAEVVHLGAYRLNDKLRDDMDHWQVIEPNLAAILETVGNDAQSQFLVQGDYLYWGELGPRPDDPQVGDLRIRFQEVPPGEVSLMAQLTGNSFTEFHTSNGEPIQRLYSAVLTATEFMERLELENTLMAWGLRLLGLALCVGGLALIMGPAKALVSWIPLVGDLTGGLIFVVALLLGCVISLTTISIAWIAVRPLLGIALLAIAAAALFLLFKMKKSVHEEPMVIDDNMLVN